MPRIQLAWGAGLSIALRSPPALITPPVLVTLLSSVVVRNLPIESSSKLVQVIQHIPAALRTGFSLILYSLCRRTLKNYQRRADRRRLGPDVVEVPRVKLNWPWNLDLIWYILRTRETDYCAAPWDGLVERYGNTFNLRLFGEDQIVTVEPENIKAILHTDFHSYEKGSEFRGKMFSVLGRGVFNADGEIWKFHRRTIRPYFARNRICHFDNFARHSDIVISKILARLTEPVRPGVPVAIDFQDAIARFALDSGTEFLFGQDFNSLEAPLPYPSEEPSDDATSFAAAFGRVQDLIAYRFGWGGLWPWMELFWDRTREDMNVVDRYVTPILKKRLEERRALRANEKPRPTHRFGDANPSDEAGDTLLDHMMQFTDDEVSIKDQMVNILIAARDTTASTLTFAVYMLAENPAVLSKLRSEVMDHLGMYNYPTSDNLKEMQYMRAVLNETLRLFPAVPMNERTAVRSTVLQSDGKKYYVPAGATMPFCTLHVHRRRDLWGPDADEFDPERWIDERLTKYFMPNPAIFLPFMLGPRSCLGQQFAYNEMSFFLCRLLQRIESIELAPEAQPKGTLPPPEWKNGKGRMINEKVWPKSHLNLYCNGGLWIRVKKASLISG